jgi:two-component system, LytTR family, response regulator
MSDRPIRTIIVDDEELARRGIELRLAPHADVEIVGHCTNGREAIAAVTEQKPDLMFLDIQMPDLDGFGVLSALDPEQQPVTVFVTAYDRYAIQAFEAHAIDYLLKPFSDQRFEGALRRACQFLRSRTAGEAQHGISAALEERGGSEPRDGFLDRFVLTGGGRVTFLGVEDVDWIEASGVYVNLHVGSRSHLYRSSLAHLLQRLDPRRFVRVHRSLAVNTERIRELQPRSHGDYTVILKSGTELVMSRGFRPQFEQWLKQPL